MRRSEVKTEKEIAKAKVEADTRLNQLYDNIVALSESTVILYDRVEDYFFQDVDFQVLQGSLLLWMADAGRSPESGWDRLLFDKVRQIYNDPMSNRILHWYDVQNLISAFQDRITAISQYLRDIFSVIPAYCLYSNSDYTGASRDMSPYADQVHASINSVFVSLSSAFDLFTKIVYECANYNPIGFTEYKRLKSRANSILYAKKNYGFDELKESGLLYDEPACIRTICSFRDEFIHCGSWDFRNAIYNPVVNGIPVEPFIPMPDVDSTGLLVCSGSRNKFYSLGLTINTALPALVGDVIDVLSKTESRLKEVLIASLKPLPQAERLSNTQAYMTILSRNMSRLAKVIKRKGEQNVS